jgi:TolB-like protein
MDALATHVIYEFGDFRLDASRGVLYAKVDATVRPIAPHVFEAALYFVEHPGELLGKDRLLAVLWPRAVVEENSLNRVVSDLRRVLGESPGENRYIATVPGRGYRFVADVVRLARTTVQRSPDDAVAVLPFVSTSSHPEDEVIARAIAENVLQRLAATGRLCVIAQISSFGALGQGTDAREIGRRLGARYLVEGSLQHEASRLRVMVRLIDSLLGTHAWSGRFECAAGDLFAAEDEIAQPVASALEASLCSPLHAPGW